MLCTIWTFVVLLYKCTNVCLFFIAGASSSNVILIGNNSCSICPISSLSASIVADTESCRGSIEVEFPDCVPIRRFHGLALGSSKAQRCRP